MPNVAGCIPVNVVTWLSRLGKFGYLGVDVFFLLSGFLITGILLREMEASQGGVMRRFYARRLLRIFPTFYLTIVVCYVFFPGYNYIYQSLYLSNYYFTFSDGAHPLRHTWSLAVEEQFYLLWPVVLLLSHRLRKMRQLPVLVCCVSVAGTFVQDVLLPLQVSDPLSYRGLESRMLSLAIGSHFAINGVPRLPIGRVIAGVLGLYAIAAVVKLLLMRNDVDVPTGTVKQVCFSGISSLLFVLCYHSKGGLRTWLTSPAARFLGRISYGLYLYHVPVLFAFGVSHMQVTVDSSVSLRTLLAAYMGSAAAAIGSWYLIEKPLLGLKERFALRVTAYDWGLLRNPHSGGTGCGMRRQQLPHNNYAQGSDK